MTTSVKRVLGLAALATAAAALLVPAATADSTPAGVTVKLLAADGSKVSGSASLAAVGQGTKVVLAVRGLAPRGSAISRLHAGTSLHRLSASFAALPSLRANPGGRAKAGGLVLFRGTQPVALADIADGEHVIVIRANGRVLAWGVVPPF